MTRAEKKAFLALVHALCDLMTSGGIGQCTRGSKRHATCNALNCKPYAIALQQREKIMRSAQPQDAEHER